MSKRIMRYTNNERIIKAGTIEQRMYIILEGKVSISLSDGENLFEVAELKKGDFFGEISLFTNTPRSANVTAVVMVTEVLFAGVSAVMLGAGTLSLQLLAGGALIVGAALLSVAERPRA